MASAGTSKRGEGTAILGKLLKLQGEAIALQKDAINPHFKNTYITLNELMGKILPKLNELGLVLMQTPTTLGGTPAMTTTIADAESGEVISDTMALVLDRPTPQAQGSAITYARRYALMSMLGLVADEDDDGNKATPVIEIPSNTTF